MKKNCLKCEMEFNVKPTTLRRGGGRGQYCSFDCRKYSYKNYRPTQATKDKLSIALKGRVGGTLGKHWKLSDITKLKMSNNKKGISNKNWIGPKNPHWKGGVSKENKTERQLTMETLEYRNWRREVFERDHYACVMCGDDKGGNLEADHIVPVIIRKDLIFDVENGRTLCKECHEKVTVAFNKMYWKNQFSRSENWDLAPLKK